jgi:hypothetical protein
MRIPVVCALLLSLNSGALCRAQEPPISSADDIVARMLASDRQRENMGGGYTGNRRYVLENQRFNKHAEMTVAVNCDADGTKHFKVMSELGSKSANQRVLRRMLESEAETSRPETRPTTRVSSDNYEFQLLGTEVVEGRSAYVIQALPKRSDKYLFEGRIWIDAEDFALARAEGHPAKNPSFWTRSVYFVHVYRKAGSFWFPFSSYELAPRGRTPQPCMNFERTGRRPRTRILGCLRGACSVRTFPG